ncbi:hypothetical protein CDV31_003519 [Fusarium ambrosium]|uniref:Uncharacterized protein n=1 Tax=Fusarium ambrosium TaxID=131363 RepID=A0A428UTI3_9HYPO|nr:hypothetical protein CDV31_003519 [Fusarium ambrosium]
MDHGPSCWAGASKLDLTGLDWTQVLVWDWDWDLTCSLGSVVYYPVLEGEQTSKNEVPEPAAITLTLWSDLAAQLED